MRRSSLVALTGLVLAACGSDQAPSVAVSPATVATPAFHASVPSGWQVATSNPAIRAGIHSSGTVVAVLATAPVSPVAGISNLTPTITVSTIPDAPIPDDAVTSYLDNVSANGATQLSSATHPSVGGATGTGITYDHRVSGTPARARDIVVTHGGTSYEIVVDAAVPEFADADQALTSLLSSWAWS